MVAACVAVVLVIGGFIGYEPQPAPPPTDTAAITLAPSDEPVVILPVAAAVPEIAPLPKKVPAPAPISVPAPPVQTTTTIITTTTTTVPPPVAPVAPVVLSRTIGTTTIAIQSVPLLSGGVVHAGEWVPISYLQMTNVGSAGALLKGFKITQNGSAPTESIIGLSTVDDQGGSRGLAGGVEGSVLFENGVALAPTDAYFAPGQMRLFTVKARVRGDVSLVVGTELTLVVSAIETAAAVQGQFPIAGTTWTIAL